jgi:hypothetical protein
LTVIPVPGLYGAVVVVPETVVVPVSGEELVPAGEAELTDTELRLTKSGVMTTLVLASVAAVGA